MRAKLCLFMILAFLSPIASAEYYLVYHDCYGSGCHYVRHCYHHKAYKVSHKKHKRHYVATYHRRSGYNLAVYYYYPPAAPCYSCGCDGCYAPPPPPPSPCGIYTGAAAPCVTYDDVMAGYRYRDDYMDP